MNDRYGNAVPPVLPNCERLIAPVEALDAERHTFWRLTC